MIFMAIGTTDFNTLVQAMDDLSPTLSEEVVMQIGHSRYVPKHCEYFRFVPSLEPYYERASLVVSHGGLGIVTEVLERQLPLVAVEDPDQPDRHQQQILRVWSEQNHLVWCRDVAQLAAAMKQAETGLQPYHRPPCTIHNTIADFLQQHRAR